MAHRDGLHSVSTVLLKGRFVRRMLRRSFADIELLQNGRGRLI